MNRPIYNLELSGKKMRQIRQEKNITVRQVMEFMGFESTQAIYKWEAGKCFPQADNLMALAIYYQVNPFELIVEEDTKASSSFMLRPAMLVSFFMSFSTPSFVNHRFIYKNYLSRYNHFNS